MGKFSKKRNPNISLEKLGIKKGDKLRFVPASHLESDMYVTVVDEQNVSYNGETMTRAEFNYRYNDRQRQGTKTHEMQSPRYFSYNGHLLSELWKDYCNDQEKFKLPQEEDKEEENKKTEQGFIYVLSNPSFKDNCLKIGQTTKSVKERVKSLNNTSVPYDFKIELSLKVPNPEETEKALHELLGRHRVTRRREFFFTSLEEVKRIIDFMCKINHEFKIAE